jgi:hypothetical protein
LRLEQARAWIVSDEQASWQVRISGDGDMASLDEYWDCNGTNPPSWHPCLDFDAALGSLAQQTMALVDW